MEELPFVWHKGNKNGKEGGEVEFMIMYGFFMFMFRLEIKGVRLIKISTLLTEFCIYSFIFLQFSNVGLQPN